MLSIIMYHYVRDLRRSRYPTIKGLDAAAFRQQMDFLKDNFNLISMEDILSSSALPDNAALLTFDDGYIDHYTTVFPILDEMGIQGSFFPPSGMLKNTALLDVNKIHFILAAADAELLSRELLHEIDVHRGTEFDIPDSKTLWDKYAIPNRFDSGTVIFIKRMLQTVLPELLRNIIAEKLFRQFVGIDEAVFVKELYCDTAQLKTMKKHGMFIGLHGNSHNRLGNMNKNEYEEDISAALDYMCSSGLIDKKAWVMCYPYGSWNDGVLDYIKANGCVLGLTTEARQADIMMDNKLLLPRFDTNDFPPVSRKFEKDGFSNDM